MLVCHLLDCRETYTNAFYDFGREIVVGDRPGGSGVRTTFFSIGGRHTCDVELGGYRREVWQFFRWRRWLG